jgi:hypothetical protein
VEGNGADLFTATGMLMDHERRLRCLERIAERNSGAWALIAPTISAVAAVTAVLAIVFHL